VRQDSSLGTTELHLGLGAWKVLPGFGEFGAGPVGAGQNSKTYPQI